MLEYIILGTLYSNDLTGYDIRKCIESGIGMFYRASYGSIYPILSKLSEKAYVICVEEVQGKRVKTKYSITKDGKDAFLTWLKEDEDNNSSIESFMARVYFFDLLPSDLTSIKIKEYQMKLLAYQSDLLKKKEKYDAMEHKEAFYFKLSTLYFGICKLQSIITWCDIVKQGMNLETLIPVKGE